MSRGNVTPERSVSVEALALIVTSLRQDLVTIAGLTPAQVRAVGQLVGRASGDIDLAYIGVGRGGES